MKKFCKKCKEGLPEICFAMQKGKLRAICRKCVSKKYEVYRHTDKAKDKIMRARKKSKGKSLTKNRLSKALKFGFGLE